MSRGEELPYFLSSPFLESILTVAHISPRSDDLLTPVPFRISLHPTQ